MHDPRLHIAGRFQRRLQRSDDADALRKAWQRQPALQGEQPFMLELGAQAGEGLEQRANAGMAQGLDIELEPPAGLVKRDEGARLHAHAVLQQERQQLGAAAEHDAVDLGAFVLQGEVEMAGCGAAQVGNFATDPQQRKAAFQRLAREAVER